MSTSTKILAIWPPHVPTYFNEGHRTPMYMLAAYLRRREGTAVTTLDAGALNYTWKDIANLLADEQFDLIAVMNEYGTADAVGRFCEYARRISPRSKIVTYGRLSGQIPEFFQRYALDAIVASGDYEAGVAAYLDLLHGRRSDTPGVTVRSGASWSSREPGKFLDPNDWAFPDIFEIPYEAYDRLYLNDSRKFCGIPERRELVVPVARGCPVNCSYCEVPRQQGLKERRRSVEAVVEYIEKSFARMAFEYVSFYAPTFTLNRAWTQRLAHELILRSSKYPWKCVTTAHHLDQELIQLMAKSGCMRISIGLETLDPPAKLALPKLKRTEESRFRELAEWCSAASIELNCFIILGLPGQTIAGAKYTLEQVRAVGARTRPTIYTPYERMTPDMVESTVISYDRQFFVEGLLSEEEEQAFYRLAFGTEPSPTKVMSKIQRRNTPAEANT